MDTQDVVIIGGGITGVGIAQAIAAAGFSVTLWERNTLGSETSSNSSKLIHGGLRYLESGQLSLVRQCLKERQALLNLAPSLVHPLPFYLPVYSGAARGSIKIAAGLSLYAFLNEFDALSQFSSVPRSEWNKLTSIKKVGLKRIFKYWDAQTDDLLLTQAVSKSAQNLGADIYENMDCSSIYHGAHVCQLTGENKKTDHISEIKSRLVVNACGPWVNDLLMKVSPIPMLAPVEWAQGSHLLLDIPPPTGVYYLESHLDKRMVFIMPWQDKTLIGTTEVKLPCAPKTVEMKPYEQHYLLKIYQYYFSQYDLSSLKNLIVKEFCGVRVLPVTDGGIFDRPRDTVIEKFPSHPCLLAVYGGKLTGFRTTAKEVVTWVQSRLGRRDFKVDIDRLIIK